MWSSLSLRSVIIGSPLTALLLLSPTPGSAYELNELWTIEGAFSMPESAVIDSEREVVYISNVNTYARDGNGFISRVSLNGDLLELDWITGLDSPTGMAISGSRLFVADFDKLVEIDLDRATIVRRYPAPDAAPALNDVTVSGTGAVFVSGSTSNTIYTLAHDQLDVWLQDDELLLRANGLLAVNDVLVHGGNQWSVFDLQTKALLSEQIYPEPRAIDIDGITTDACGGYLYTLLDDSRIHRVTPDGQAYPLSGTDFDGIDLQRVGNQLVVPRVGGDLSLIQVNSNNCDHD